MKNIKFLFSLFLCLIFLLTSTVSQAVTAPTSIIKTEITISSKKQIKLERLEQKLSKRLAKIKQRQRQKNTERESIEKNSKNAVATGIIGLLVAGVSYGALLGSSESLIILLAIAVFLLAIVSFVCSGKALKRIKNSSNPEQYKKSENRAEAAVGIALLTLMGMALITGIWFAFAGLW